MKPKISVAFCSYNGERFIKQQLDSILNQTVSVDEIIICDDISKDSTIQIINEYQLSYPGLIHLNINEKNIGSVLNFENAIKKCTGEIIFLSDQDDVWLPNKVEVILKKFEENPSVSVIATNAFLIDEKNRFVKSDTLWDLVGLFKQKKIKISYFNIITEFSNIATGATMAIKKDYVKAVIPFPVQKDLHHDEWIAIISSMENSFLFIDNDKLIKYRVHKNQQVGGVQVKNIKNTIQFDSDSKLLFKYYKLRLKKLAKTINFFISINENTMGSLIIENLVDKFHKTRNEMKEKHPIKSYFLYYYDILLKKRQLNDSEHYLV